MSSYSQWLLPQIDWEPTERGNVLVLNDTADFCHFFDATPHAELLIECVRRTFDKDLPHETDFLRRYDQFTGSLQAIADMPGRTSNLLFRFLRQNGGHLLRRARDGEFKELTIEKTERTEHLYAENFEPPPETRSLS